MTQRVRILLGAVSDTAGGRALVLTLGLGPGMPTVCLTLPDRTAIDLDVERGPIANSGRGPAPELPSRLEEVELRVFRVEIPAGLSGDLELLASLGGCEAEARFRPYPTAPGRVSFAVASCYYSYFREAETYGDWMAKAASSPQFKGHRIDFKILTGDNVYMDVAEDKGRFEADEAEAEVAHRYADYLGRDDALAAALSSSPTFATFDDHDFWNDFPHEVVWLSRTYPEHREQWRRASWDGIDTFLSPLNPISEWEGRSYAFVAGGVPFFVADTRTNRTSVHDDRPRLMLEEERMALVDWLEAPGGPRVLVMGQPLWLDKGGLTDSNLAAYEEDFAAICDAIADCPSEVLVLTGDPHYSRVLKLETRGRPAKTVYEVISSPAVHIPPSLSIGRSKLDRDHVKIDRDVDFRCRADAKLHVADYLFGSSCNTTFALLTLEPRADQTVAVTVTFLDHRGGLGDPYPPAEPADPWDAPSVRDATVEFTLRKR